MAKLFPEDVSYIKKYIEQSTLGETLLNELREKQDTYINDLADLPMAEVYDRISALRAPAIAKGFLIDRVRSRKLELYMEQEA
jgi:hypothetical protein